jgi:hypothetical protein
MLHDADLSELCRYFCAIALPLTGRLAGRRAASPSCLMHEIIFQVDKAILLETDLICGLNCLMVSGVLRR